MSEISKKLSNILNPSTGKTLEEENRWQEINEEDGKLKIKYNRDGISPVEKRKIEEDIVSALSGDFAEENITVMTTSTRSQDVYKAVEEKVAEEKIEEAPKEEKANLKVGHGTVGNKREVPGVGKVIAVSSGKGGVGKSTFSVNLAITLSKMGKKVGLIDADIYGPSLPMLMGKRGVRPSSSPEKKIIPLEAHGVKFISFGLFIGENEPVIWRGPMLGGVLNQFLFDVDWKDTDYLIIDLPPGTGDIQLSMVQNTNVDGVVVISTPQDVAILDSVKGLEMFKKIQTPILGMVENMSTFVCSECGTEHNIFGKGGVKKVATDNDLNYLGSIPLELELREGSDTGRPYMSNEAHVDKPVYKAFHEVSSNILGMYEKETEKRKSFFQGLFGK
jgi:ATP-binding protein involved in chromosome partitioning